MIQLSDGEVGMLQRCEAQTNQTVRARGADFRDPLIGDGHDLRGKIAVGPIMILRRHRADGLYIYSHLVDRGDSRLDARKTRQPFVGHELPVVLERSFTGSARRSFHLARPFRLPADCRFDLLISA